MLSNGGLTMPRKDSAGLLLYRIESGVLEVFLVHPGGPFWARRDNGAWSIPKGEFDPGEDALAAARREFREETGRAIDGEFIALDPLRQPGGKTVHAWAVKGSIDAASIHSNVFSMEWPPRSGIHREFPEVDAGGWFTVERAMEKLLPGQRPFLLQLQAELAKDAQ
jgi:predicted NUDIX family NTP pyrophosphohydrolase